MEYALTLIALVALGVIVWISSSLYYARRRCWSRGDKITPGRRSRIAR